MEMCNASDTNAYAYMTLCIFADEYVGVWDTKARRQEKESCTDARDLRRDAPLET